MTKHWPQAVQPMQSVLAQILNERQMPGVMTPFHVTINTCTMLGRGRLQQATHPDVHPSYMLVAVTALAQSLGLTVSERPGTLDVCSVLSPLPLVLQLAASKRETLQLCCNGVKRMPPVCLSSTPVCAHGQLTVHSMLSRNAHVCTAFTHINREARAAVQVVLQASSGIISGKSGKSSQGSQPCPSCKRLVASPVHPKNGLKGQIRSSEECTPRSALSCSCRRLGWHNQRCGVRAQPACCQGTVFEGAADLLRL